MTKKEEEKKPLDMTTDEAMEYLFSKEGAQKMKEAVQAQNPSPSGDENGSKLNSKSARKQDSK
jgi:hypothetical protein